MLLVIDGDTLLYSISVIDNTIDVVYKIFDNKLKKILNKFDTNEYIFILEGNRNFRNKYDVNYKKHRTAEKPKHFKALKSYIVNKYKNNLILATNIETDDVCSIVATKCLELDIHYVIVHIDKDLNQIIGQHYNPNKDEEYYVDEDYAKYILCYQIIKGDVTDSKITGIKGYGDKKAFELLNYAKDNNIDYLTASFNEFIKVYGDVKGVYNFYVSFNIINLLTTYPKLNTKIDKLINVVHKTEL